MKKLFWGAVALLYLLRFDVWFWHDAPRLPWAGTLPAGFVYHVGFCVLVAGVMWVWVKTVPSPGSEAPGYSRSSLRDGAPTRPSPRRSGEELSPFGFSNGRSGDEESTGEGS